MNKLLRDLLISAQPGVIGIFTALTKAMNDQSFTQATLWIIGGGLVSSALAVYMHFLTSASATPASPNP